MAASEPRSGASPLLAIVALLVAIAGASLAYLARSDNAELKQQVASLREEVRELKSAPPVAAVAPPLPPPTLPPPGPGRGTVIHSLPAAAEPVTLDVSAFRAKHAVTDSTWAALEVMNREWIAAIERAQKEPGFELEAIATARWKRITALLPEPAMQGEFLALERGPTGPGRKSVLTKRGTRYEASRIP